MAKIILHALEDDAHLGDKHQVQAVAQALLKRLQIEQPSSDITVQNESEAEFSLGASEEEAIHIVLCSGSHGLLKVQELKAQHPEVSTVWTGHQYFEEIDKAHILPDVMQFPQGVLAAKQRESLEGKTTLLEALGVPHKVTAENIEAVDLDDFTVGGEVSFLDEYMSASRVIGVMLAGDAPDASGKMKYFTPEDATKKAQHIFAKVKEVGLDDKTLFWINNGPRTGSHDYEQDPPTQYEADNNYHTWKLGETPVYDPVTKAFKDELERLLQGENLDTEHCVDLFPFLKLYAERDAKPEIVSGYLPLMKMLSLRQASLVIDARNPDYYFVPSESTSMVTESNFLVAKGVNVVAYRPESESDAHEAHLQTLYDQGGLGVLQKDGSYNEPDTRVASNMVLATECIVATVVPSILEKIRSKDMTQKALRYVPERGTSQEASPWYQRAQDAACGYGRDAAKAASDFYHSDSTASKVVKYAGLAAVGGLLLFAGARSGALRAPSIPIPTPPAPK